MSDSKSIADYDKVQFRAVFVPDGETADATLLEGISDPVVLRVELTDDQDEDEDAESGSETGSSSGASG